MILKAGCDPGYANLGWSWLDEAKQKALMWKVDLRKWDGKKHDLGIADIGPCVYEFCVAHKKFFDLAKEYAVERLPDKVGNKDTNLLVRDVMTAMTQTIHILYPHIRIYYVSPVTMKAFTKTGGAKSHSESKKRTSKCGILPYDKMQLALRTFQGKRGKLQVDPIDSTIASMLLRDHKHKMITSRYHKTGEVRKFHIDAMSSEVVYPAPRKRQRTIK